MMQKISPLPFILTCCLTIPRILVQAFIVLAIPVLSKELNLTPFQSQILFPVFTLGIMIFLIPAGRIGDRFGSRQILIVSTYFYLFFSMMAGLASNPILFLFSLFFIGATSAFSMTQASAYVTEIYPFMVRGRVIGLFGGLVSLSFFLGPTIGGVVAGLGQAGIFFSMLPLVVLALLFTKFMPRIKREEKMAERYEYFQFISIPFISHCVMALFWQAIISLLIFFPAEYQIHYGYTPAQSGLIFTVLALPFPIFSPVAGWLFDRVGSTIPYSIGYLSLAIGGLLSFYGYNDESILLLCFSLAFVLPITASSSWGLFEQRHRSMATGIYYLLRFSGSIVGSLLAGYFLIMEKGSQDIFFLNFMIALLFAFLSIPAFILSLKGKKV
ncbi:MAG: MFS transporter [Chlamydiae bacterium]|nr:MFS transporter [Chlamydiota bacterium]